MSTEAVLEEVSALLERSSRILCFTGAGISTPSRIPDYRGPNGVWKTRQPVYYDAFIASESARIEYWSYKLDAQAAFRDALPNAAHDALVELERAGKLLLLVTQNIDGLHRRAGTSSARLIELHGTNSEAICIGCEWRVEMAACLDAFERDRRPPRCDACGELMKPAVVMFGQSLDAEALRGAFAAARNADLVLSLGSSLSVTPAADIPLAAARHGAPYVIVNQGATPHDSVASLKIDGDVAEVLPRALRRAMNRRV
jgi:NAD-dependent deacetylase